MSDTFVYDGLTDWNENQYEYYFDNIFQDQEFTDFLKNIFRKQKTQITSYVALIDILKKIFNSQIHDPKHDLVKLKEKFAAYEARANQSFLAYMPDDKPNPKAVYWPNPKRNPGESLDNVLPYVKNFNLIARDTPIGSAGSCFAYEIAYYLQKKGFNYVITEKGHEPEKGVVCEAYAPENPYEHSCASWGILFNSPSFAQLAEKAFGLRELPRCLVKYKLGDEIVYLDPYREGIYFASPEAYESNYDQHINAVRQALLRSRLFIMTLGLNECWEHVVDGSFISRNPSNLGFTALLKKRVLTVEENVSYIRRFIEVIRQHNPLMKFIVTVSPIPLIATTRAEEYHVITANQHSKAVLRVVADILAKEIPDVFYLPSYEMVMSCIPNAWEDDLRHVKRSAVERIMELFEIMFVKQSEKGFV